MMIERRRFSARALVATMLVLGVSVIARGRFVSLSGYSVSQRVQMSLEDLGCTVWRDSGRQRDLTRSQWQEMLGVSVAMTVTLPEGLGDDGVAMVARFLTDEPAVALWLDQSAATSNGLRSLAQIKHLQALSLPDRLTTPEDFGQLANLPELFLVSLGGERLSDESLRPLSHLPRLTHLVLGESRLTDDALKHLEPLRRLTRFIYYKVPFSQPALDALRNARPGLLVIEHKPRYGC